MSSSVVIVSYRPGEWLAGSVTSVVSQASQVVVVDNGSPGEEASKVAWRLGATAVRSGVNLGFAGGVELGLHHATGDVIGVLNDDAVAGENWIASAENVLEDRGVAAVTPKVVLDPTFGEVLLEDEVWFSPGDPRPLGRQLRSVTVDGREVIDDLLGPGVYGLEQAAVEEKLERWRWTAGPKPFYIPLANRAQREARDSYTEGDDSHVVELDGEPVGLRAVCTLLNHAGSFLDPYGLAGEFGFGAPDDGRFDEPAERFGFSATAPVFRAETMKRLGGFASQFFAYNEDTDWCLRARLSGMRVVYDPTATVFHRLSATSGGVKDAFVRFLAERNAILCLLRNAPVSVARRALLRSAPDDPHGKVRRAVLAKLPWAVASRLRMRRHWLSTPEEIWERWAGVDSTWDLAPSRIGG